MRAGRSVEDGSASLLTVSLLALLLFLTVAGSVVGGLVSAHRRAQSAADLAALAGAVAARDDGDPCVGAASVAAANGAEVTSCAVAERTVTLEVIVEGPSFGGRSFALSARARAGPR